ncbi:Atg15 [Acrasis kona]|uniref:Atg15 n=1 Tax=Acrasis kona TaxID=1008807 RepID=A0AAW2ZGP6_9EUKA
MFEIMHHAPTTNESLSTSNGRLHTQGYLEDGRSTRRTSNSHVISNHFGQSSANVEQDSCRHQRTRHGYRQTDKNQSGTISKDAESVILASMSLSDDYYTDLYKDTAEMHDDKNIFLLLNELNNNNNNIANLLNDCDLKLTLSDFQNGSRNASPVNVQDNLTYIIDKDSPRRRKSKPNLKVEVNPSATRSPSSLNNASINAFSIPHQQQLGTPKHSIQFTSVSPFKCTQQQQQQPFYSCMSNGNCITSPLRSPYKGTIVPFNNSSAATNPIHTKENAQKIVNDVLEQLTSVLRLAGDDEESHISPLTRRRLDFGHDR